MIKLFILAGIFIGLALLGLSLSIIFKKDGKFPAYSVGKNAEMRKRNIKCVQCEEVATYKKSQRKKEINPQELKIAR